MSPALPNVSGTETVRALQRAGFERISQRGSHVKLRHPEGRTTVVPMHRELAPGTLASVLKQTGLTVERFNALL